MVQEIKTKMQEARVGVKGFAERHPRFAFVVVMMVLTCWGWGTLCAIEWWLWRDSIYVIAPFIVALVVSVVLAYSGGKQ